MQKFQVLQ